MTLDLMARQLMQLPGSLNLTITRYNPRPAGVIRQGSASELALFVLRNARGQWLTHAQIRSRSGCTQKALSWALIFLYSQDLIDRTADESRNQRYLRYCAKGSKP